MYNPFNNLFFCNWTWSNPPVWITLTYKLQSTLNIFRTSLSNKQPRCNDPMILSLLLHKHRQNMNRINKIWSSGSHVYWFINRLRHMMILVDKNLLWKLNQWSIESNRIETNLFGGDNLLLPQNYHITSHSQKNKFNVL